MRIDRLRGCQSLRRPRPLQSTSAARSAQLANSLKAARAILGSHSLLRQGRNGLKNRPALLARTPPLGGVNDRRTDQFTTGSSVAGTDQESPFASSTNYSDAGFAWSAGGGLYVPIAAGASRVQLDLGLRWVDNGSREYLRPDGITFEGNAVQLNPVRSQAQALQFHLGVTVPVGR